MKKRIHVNRSWLVKHTAKPDKRTFRRKAGNILLVDDPTGNEKASVVEALKETTRKTIYEADLTQVISKYIGETEKNLQNLFAKAAEQQAILLFDEADALFGKRSEVKDAHDRYANRQIKYNLDKFNRYPGLVVLFVKSRKNIDPAFLRRLRYSTNLPKR